MEWVEASGKSLPEAKEIAVDLLGVAEDDAEFVLLSEPKAGLFGRLRGEARVKARVRPVAPPPKRGRRQRPDRGRAGGDRSGSSGSKSRSGSGSQRRGERGDQSEPRGNGSRARSQASTADVTRAEGPGDNGSAPIGSGPERTAATGSGATQAGRGRRSRGANRGAVSNGAKQERQGSGQKSGDSEDTMEESLTLEQQGEAASEFVAGLVREFGLDATVTYTEIDEDTVQVAATGDDLGFLVGPRGATLAAVQDLTRTFVQRQSENRTDRILVDVGGYREKRSAALRRFAEGIVHEVKSSGEERALEPMSPADRKVVHDAVNEIEGVETRSDGTEPSRYVVIQPST
ncbi:MAG: Jag N-terminal domain-containing protein [Acidimicrobiales bacterium]|nr:Jag N-terminal domain-containing protein [Acidimicrobiales bacterium]